MRAPPAGAVCWWQQSLVVHSEPGRLGRRSISGDRRAASVAAVHLKGLAPMRVAESPRGVFTLQLALAVHLQQTCH